jgi:hypothetical protein
MRHASLIPTHRNEQHGPASQAPQARRKARTPAGAGGRPKRHQAQLRRPPKLVTHTGTDGKLVAQESPAAQSPCVQPHGRRTPGVSKRVGPAAATGQGSPPASRRARDAARLHRVALLEARTAGLHLAGAPVADGENGHLGLEHVLDEDEACLPTGKRQNRRAHGRFSRGNSGGLGGSTEPLEKGSTARTCVPCESPRSYTTAQSTLLFTRARLSPGLATPFPTSSGSTPGDTRDQRRRHAL